MGPPPQIVGWLAFGPSPIHCFFKVFDMSHLTAVVISKLGRSVVGDVGCKA